MIRLLVAAGTVFSGAAEAQVGLGLSPLRVEADARPAGVVSGPLTLSNESSARVRFRAELLDFYIDDSATPQFSRAFARENEYSCRNWLSLNPMEAEIEPGNNVTVRFTLSLPPNTASRGYHCAAGFTTMPTAEQAAAGMGLRTAVRMVTAFYLNTGNPAIEAGLTGLRVEQTGDPKNPVWQAVVILKNWGLRYFRPEGEIELFDPAGKVVESVKVPSMPVLPNREQRLPVPLKTALQQGEYRLRARVSLGTPEVHEAVATTVLAAPPGPSSQ
jgi:hypothetical protein